MGDKLINIGYGNYVSAARVVALVAPDSAPIKRMIRDAQERSMLIDATYGRRTRAVVITDSEHVVLCAMQPETLAHRLDAQSDVDMDDADDAPGRSDRRRGRRTGVIYVRSVFVCRERVCLSSYPARPARAGAPYARNCAPAISDTRIHIDDHARAAMVRPRAWTTFT